MTLMNLPEIETDRLVLCEATTTDLVDWAARVFADLDVIRYLPNAI